LENSRGGLNQRPVVGPVVAPPVVLRLEPVVAPELVDEDPEVLVEAPVLPRLRTPALAPVPRLASMQPAAVVWPVRAGSQRSGLEAPVVDPAVEPVVDPVERPPEAFVEGDAGFAELVVCCALAGRERLAIPKANRSKLVRMSYAPVDHAGITLALWKLFEANIDYFIP
jgi:hypothetical protein